jgi:hypothetical protein
MKQSKDLGYQVSVSKTFGVSTQAMWEFLLSDHGLEVWLGKISSGAFDLMQEFVTQDGTQGMLRVFVPDCHVRYKWKPSTFEKPSTVELRVVNAKGKAKVIFHHTGFYQKEQQEILRTYWKNVISRMTTALL